MVSQAIPRMIQSYTVRQFFRAQSATLATTEAPQRQAWRSTHATKRNTAPLALPPCRLVVALVGNYRVGYATRVFSVQLLLDLTRSVAKCY